MDRQEKTSIKKSIGIGVSTTPNRKEHFNLWLDKFNQVKPDTYHLHIHEDYNYRGVAYSKNQSLNALKGCDYIFLFDDDCFPIAHGWEQYFINSGENHLLYLNPTHGILAKQGELEYYQNCGGVFMFMTKECIDKVGFMNSEYQRYGFEHAGYSNRIFRAGLTRSPYQQLRETSKYIYSMDYSGAYYNLRHKSAITDEEKKKEIEINRDIFINELNSSKIFYKFAD